MSKERLREIIAEKSLRRGDFTLASGAKSNYIIDLKKSVLDPEGASLVADLVMDNIANDDVDAIGGLELGACPIVSAACVKSYELGKNLRFFYVRKEKKGRGTDQLIEGCELQHGDKIIMIEDVTTTGGSVIKAIEIVKDMGFEVAKVLSVVDRLEGAGENLNAVGVRLESIFTRDDFV